MLDANTEILNQDIVCLVSEVGPILYMFLEETKIKTQVRSLILCPFFVGLFVLLC